MVTRASKSTPKKSSNTSKPGGGEAGAAFEVVSEPHARLYLADDIRTESTGKVMAIGLYPDLIVILQVPADAPPPTDEVPYGIGRLAFMITIGGVEGTGPVTIQLAEGGPEKTLTVTIQPGGSANLISTAEPLLIKSFGVKQARVTFAGATISLRYEIRKGVLPQ